MNLDTFLRVLEETFGLENLDRNGADHVNVRFDDVVVRMEAADDAVLFSSNLGSVPRDSVKVCEFLLATNSFGYLDGHTGIADRHVGVHARPHAAMFTFVSRVSTRYGDAAALLGALEKHIHVTELLTEELPGLAQGSA